MRDSTLMLTPLRIMSPLKLALPLAALFLALSCAFADIFWDDCTSEVSRGGIDDGDLYNLCIIDHEFENENHAWKLTKAQLQEVKFSNCLFTNMMGAPNNFTEASWTDVEFDHCSFGSIDSYGKSIVFDKTAMVNVHFKSCVFDQSVSLLFTEFSMNNVSFTNCSFKGDTMFTLGEINEISFVDSRIRHSDAAEIMSGDDAFTMRMVTVTNMLVLGCDFVAPVRMEGVNAGTMSINETTMNQLHCHSPREQRGVSDKVGSIEYHSSFNNSVFQQVSFDDTVTCDETVWRGFFMANTSFYSDADFSASEMSDVWWDEVTMKSSTADCRTLNFAETSIERKVFANISIACIGNFERSSFDMVYVHNFYAGRPNFKEAIFTNQEYVDGQCCSVACLSLGCRCNVTTPSGNCPETKSNLRSNQLTWRDGTTDDSCFPEDATLRLADGRAVAMKDVVLGDRVIVAPGNSISANDGSIIHSDVFFFGHHDSQAKAKFVAISHSGSSSKPLLLSASHYLYVNGALQVAGAVRKGDVLRSGEDGKDRLTVDSVETGVVRRGMYAPTSVHGDLVVDGVVVSSYTAALHPRTAHRLLAPLRLLHALGARAVVRRFSLLHRMSWAPLARKLGLSPGPTIVHV